MSQCIRATRNALQVPVETWVNGERVITLIGMSHVGDPRFYADTTRTLQDLEEDGAVVYAEGIRYANGTVPGTRVLQTLVIHEIFGDLVHQIIALPPKKHWRLVDLTVEELFAQADDPAALQKTIDPGLSIEDRRSALTVGAMLRPALVPVLATLGSLNGGQIGVNRRVILDLRNERVMDAVLAEDHDAALVWGTAHLPGMGQILTTAGYELAARTWRPVMAPQRIIDGIRAARNISASTGQWPWVGQEVPETVPVDQARALLRERGWLTDPVAA